jgi:hypothetical protein
MTGVTSSTTQSPGLELGNIGTREPDHMPYTVQLARPMRELEVGALHNDGK